MATRNGLARLRAGHGRANSPPDCLLGPPFRVHSVPIYKKAPPKGGVFLYGDPERTRTVDLQRDRLAC